MLSTGVALGGATALLPAVARIGIDPYGFMAIRAGSALLLISPRDLELPSSDGRWAGHHWTQANLSRADLRVLHDRDHRRRTGDAEVVVVDHEELAAGIAEFERDHISERVKSGLAAAKARGRKLGRQFGQRPKSDRLTPKVLALIDEGRKLDRS
ncbi:recombinase family protein [Pararhizobium sp. LjRoot235]|uniref:recombinase family protein n=1 Tax=Pararhizobium sp. LjRoot235 TaxID=3342291 RepID=UPI003F50A13B